MKVPVPNVTLHGVKVRVGNREILRIDDLTLAADGLNVIVGPSGCGKTTLLHVVAGLVSPGPGTATWYSGGHTVECRHRPKQIVLVPQAFGLIGALTVFENVALPLRLRLSSAAERKGVAQVVESTLDSVGLGGLERRLVRELSGGQQQRVAVARALALKPEVLVADEPTSELDAENRVKVMDLLGERVGLGCCVIVASHDRTIADGANYVATLDEGRVVSSKSRTT